MSDAYSDALSRMQAHGLQVHEIRADGVFHHVAVDGNKGSKKSGWYVCSELRLRNGEVALVGAFGNYKDGDGWEVIQPDAKGLTREERADLDAKRKAAEAQTSADRAARQARSEKLAPQLFGWARVDRQSEYVTRKKIMLLGAHVDRRGLLLVPVRNWDDKLIGLQFIPPDGKDKKFLTGTPKLGAFHLIGSTDDGGPLVFAEGFATAASCWLATKWPTFVCFDAGNLEHVARAAHDRFPKRPMLIAGDDDHEALDKEGKPKNTGRLKATAAAKAIGAHLAFPVFRRKKGKSDFNDLHVDEGIERVAELLRDAYATEPIGGDSDVPPPPDAGGGQFDFSLGALLERYTLVYSTTAVFDAQEHILLELTALRVAATNKVANRWLKHPSRRIVRKDDVVFDPTGQALPHQVNLFRGMPLQPKAGDCSKILELLHYLCDESDAAFDWMLKWIAYPLQNVGAKMQTAVVMHGPEGTGKNLFWGTYASLYGQYATSINQHQLEGRFNGWASAKLFIVGNEVVSRSELYHAKGGVKTMITEPTWQIEEKHLPSREERNFTNLAFLSNVLQPVAPDPDDRHYMILWTPGAREAEWYRAIAAEIKNGGREAFYHYLLNLEMDGFDEHTKPLMTQAKADLIELSLDSPERFWRQWAAGELSKPYIPAPSMMVYSFYMRWCERRGEKPLREVVFIAHLHKRMVKVKKRYDEAMDSVQRWFLIPAEWRPKQGISESAALGESVNFFRGDDQGDSHAR